LYCYLAWYFLYDNQEIQGVQIKETWNFWSFKRKTPNAWENRWD
jgi:hypothetical protein